MTQSTREPLAWLPEEWSERLREWGEPAFRGRQVFEWIHAHGVLDPSAMTNLPQALRARLEGMATPLELGRALPASDGTVKLLARLGEGKDVETVLIPRLEDVEDADGELVTEPGDAVSQCVSSQVGCAMACVFCASGLAGLKRNLSAGEIVAQVLLGRAHLTGTQRIRNIVFMGMGEPLHNYEAVARALRVLTHPWGLGLSPRRITVSTSGLVPQIDRLADEFGGQVGLAVSLHAVDDALRSRIMPINRKHPLDELVACMRRYPLPSGRRITIEYTLIGGINDEPWHADRLASLLRGISVKINLIPMNPVPDTPLEAPSERAVEAFRARVRAKGLPVFVRRQRGADIDGACGQLALYGVTPKRRVKVAVPRPDDPA